MSNFKIGIITSSLRLPLHESIRRAANLGANGIQVYATGGELSPAMPAHERRELYKYIQNCGLEVSALCGDLGHGFTDPDKNPERIEFTKRMLDMLPEFGTTVLTTHLGVIPNERNAVYETIAAACREMGEYAASVGGWLAVETGPETPEAMRGFFDELGVPGIGVNYDPANLVMGLGCDPVAGVHTLDKYIVHTHAKDGQWKNGIETPIGQGDVDFPGWISALKSIGYDGYLTIEREVGDDPAADTAEAVKILKGLIQ